jgi:autotransporter-associated beta strand protein
MFHVVAALGTLSGFGGAARADLLLYDPFDYTAGQQLGGTDPDGPGGSAGTPVGQTNTYTGGGTWYARGTASNYQSNNDTVISSGSLSYAGLAASIGNSVSYGSASPNSALFADAIDIPGADITSGSLYSSFIIRVKSNAVGTSASVRHSPLSFVTDTTSAGNAGSALASGSGSATATPGSFWMRRDPLDVTLQTTNFSPGKSNSDGIGNGAAGPSAGWQHSDSATFTESNQFGDVNGQPVADINTPASWQTYFVVMKYEFDAGTTTGQLDTVSMWMNPGAGTLGSPTGEADASQSPTGNLGSYYAAVDAFGTATVDAAAIRSFALIGHRQNIDNTMAVDVDELRIGTTWADVTPAAPATVSYHWDTNGTDPGPGASPSGNWDGIAANFNTDPDGGAAGTLTATTTAADFVTFSAGDGASNYTVTVSGAQSASAFFLEDDGVTITGGTLAVQDFVTSSGTSTTIHSVVTGGPAGSISVQGAGTLTLTANNTFTGGTSVSGGTLEVKRLQENNGVLITGGTVRILESDPGYGTGHPSGDDAQVSRPAFLNIFNDGTLDITNNDIVIDYLGASPIAEFEALVASGYNVTGDWLGDGITSSIAAQDGAYVVAVADNAALAAPFGTAQGGPLFSGVDVDLTTILIKFTHRADVDLDGLITPNDASIFGTNYSEGDPANWAMGDMDFDGIFTPNDASIFGTFYDESLASLPEPAAASVLLGAAALGMSRRRFTPACRRSSRR